MRGLEAHGLTAFQIRVLDATTQIPKGETRTYKQIAAMVGRPRAYRAVGTALRLNPFPVTIPCHRVVRSDGLGNYSGDGGRRRKMELLKMEGADIDGLR
ncbi:MAG: MGMT family protein [Candidatus Micrarchaeota archaeon]|nr:MGMT family protein [Candidatus Micrarchaeota archaeon]MDE1823758.1 MGMT family protein [Candidatus Micrarchaeota archaeon]MDE1849555.1 MGMT family protein [Candidatus Micrarchaeota archaeon]